MIAHCMYEKTDFQAGNFSGSLAFIISDLGIFATFKQKTTGHYWLVVLNHLLCLTKWLFGRRSTLLHLSGFPCQAIGVWTGTKSSTSNNHLGKAIYKNKKLSGRRRLSCISFDPKGVWLQRNLPPQIVSYLLYFYCSSIIFFCKEHTYYEGNSYKKRTPVITRVSMTIL